MLTLDEANEQARLIYKEIMKSWLKTYERDFWRGQVIACKSIKSNVLFELLLPTEYISIAQVKKGIWQPLKSTSNR